MQVTRWTYAVLGGAAAGGVGTLAMDLLSFRRARASGSEASFGEYEFSTGSTPSFEEAAAPAQVGRKAADAVGVELPEAAAGPTNDVVHWMTGVGWAVGGSLLAATTPVPALAAGLASGAGAFAGAYTILPAIGVYQPVTEYDPKTLAKDAFAHAVYGLATGLALAAIGALTTSRERTGPLHS